MSIVAIIIGGFLLLIITLQFAVRLRARRLQGKRVEGLTGSLKKVVDSGQKVLMYFYSPSCAACRTQTPLIDKLRRESPNVFKVNIANDLETARAFGVMATPSTVLIEDGIVKRFIVGARPEPVLRSLLQ